MNANGTVFLVFARSLILGRVDDDNILSTSALLVFDDRATSLAGNHLLASRLVRHLVVELQISIELG